jgi:hypothetical protein
MRFSFSQSAGNAVAHRLMREWRARIRAIVVGMAEQSATEMVADVVRKAPVGIPGYPDMLMAVRFDAMAGNAIAGVVPDEAMMTHRLRPSDTKRTVLYVYPKMVRGRATSPAAALLMRHNPWTMDTLPYEPTKREARMVSRFVSENEVKAIEKQRNDEMAGVKEELAQIIGQLKPRAKATLDRRVVRDIAFEVLRHEFGVPPVMGRAHWRPAIRAAQQRTAALLSRMAPWFMDPSNREWMRSGTIPAGNGKLMGAVVEFQDALIGGDHRIGD